MSADSLVVRPALDRDIPEMTLIYRRAVTETLVTWDDVPPDEAAMLTRLNTVTSNGYSFLTAIDEEENRVAGYAYASAFHPQSGFRFAVENSIYVHADYRRIGLGSRLLDALIRHCEASGFRQMIAGVSRPGGEASLALHEKAGFNIQGEFKGVGWKFGQWLDAVYMVRPLGPGTSRPPDER